MSHYLTNYLIVRRPLPKRINPLIRRSYAVLATLSGSYSSLWGMFPRVTQPSAARRHLSQPSPFHCRTHFYSFSESESVPPSVIGRDFLKKIATPVSVEKKKPVRDSLPLDLHVLGTPPAFILSQDQTLHKKYEGILLSHTVEFTDLRRDTVLIK